MSKKISAMPVLTALDNSDSFTVLDFSEPDPSLKNKQITKTNAFVGVTQDPPAAGNKLRNQNAWVDAGGAAVLNVGSTSVTVAAGDAPVAAVTAHTTAFDHSKLPTASQKSALDAAATLSGSDPVVAVSVMNSAISSAGHSAVTVADTATIDMTLTGQQVSASVVLQMSVTSDVSGIKLQGDSASPGATKLYGTDGTGTKGWYNQPASTGGDAVSLQGFGVTTTDPVDGNILVYRSAQSAYVLEAKPASGATPSAADVTFTPSGTIASTNVQLAIAEVASEAAPVSHVGATGTAHGDATTSVAGFMSAADKTKLDGAALLASPTFTGTPSAPTAAQGDNDTSIATTAFVNAEIAADAAPIGHVGATGTAHGNATASVAGFMSSTDKSKLDGVAPNATANAGTVTNVTGTAPISVTSGSTTPAITIAAATTSVPGSMSSADKTKLDAVTGSLVGTTDAQVLSAKTLTGLKETRVDMGSGTAIDIDAGNYFTKTITATTTFSVSNAPTAGRVGSFILELTNGAAYTLTLWSGIKWAGGTVPTLTASGVDILGFYTHDGGTTWRGLLLAKDSK